MGEIDRRIESVIGHSLIVKGEIQSSGTLRVYGVVEGSISSQGTVIVADNGVVKADITADNIVVGGTIHGNLTARKKVELLSTGKLHGDVITIAHGFVVNEGSIFEGACKMGKSEGAKATPPKPPT
jgi:cytoskeletal protein CcmA (bactofilin family)